MNNSTNPTSKILQDYIKEQSDFLSSCRPPSYEESHFKQMSDDIRSPLERQLKAVQSIADSALKSANSSGQLAQSSQSTADSASKLAKASGKIAESAKIGADLALQKSKKADIKGWISIFIAAFGVFIEFAIHHAQVIDFVKSLLGV